MKELNVQIIHNRLGMRSWGSQAHLEIMTWEYLKQSCLWEGVSLVPRQAIDLAKLIEAPPDKVWVDFADPLERGPQGEYRDPWFVIKIKHSNRVFTSYIGIKATGAKSVTLGIGRDVSVGLQDSAWFPRQVTLNSQQRKKMAAILYYWGGIGLIGFKTINRVRTKKEVLDL